jgi:hypothetical protein
LAPIEPGDSGWPARKKRLLERVHARGEALHRRAQVIRGLSVATALLLLVAVPGALAASGGGGGNKHVRTIGQPSTSTSEEPTTTAEPVTTTAPATTTTTRTATTAAPRTTTTTTAPVTSAHVCGDGSADNQPLCLTVSYGPASPRVGEEVTFHLLATDPDRIFYPETCGNVHSFGDEGAVGDCIPGCAAPSSTSVPPAKEDGRYETDYRHTYTSPGSHTARFKMRSGTYCDNNPYDSEASLSITVNVRG